MKIEFDIFYLPVQRELEVLCSKNIIHNFIPMVKIFGYRGQQIILKLTSLTADVGIREQQRHEFLFLV
jgi:hypothetical protein